MAALGTQVCKHCLLWGLMSVNRTWILASNLSKQPYLKGSVRLATWRSPPSTLNSLVVNRESGNEFNGDDLGIVCPDSLLTTSKLRSPPWNLPASLN